MPCCSILAVTPAADAWVPVHIGPANALVARHGGTFLARTEAHAQIEGAPGPARLRIVIARPSGSAARAFMGDPDDARRLGTRTEGSGRLCHLAETRDDLAS